MTLDDYNPKFVKECIAKLKEEKEIGLKEKATVIMKHLKIVDERMARALQLAQEKGSGAWLTALPLASMGYVLNKQEFRDSFVLPGFAGPHFATLWRGSEAAGWPEAVW
jgi:hypothetical protein